MTIPPKKYLQACIYEMAWESMGVYPRSVVGGPGGYEERSQWQEGWNAAHTALIDRACKLEPIFSSLTDEQASAAATLLMAGSLQYHETEGFWLICNDTFGYACADGESITVEDMPAAADMFDRFGHPGLDAWMSVKRGADVIKPLRTERFHEAYAYIRQQA